MSCISSLHSLDINSLMGLWSVNIVSYSTSCFFILLMVSFAVQKLLVICHPFYFWYCCMSEIPAAPSKLVIPRSYRRIIHFDCPWADAVFVLFFLLRFCFTSLSNRDCFHFKYAIWLQLLTEKRTKAGAKCYDLYSSGVLTKKKRLVMEFSIRDNHALTILWQMRCIHNRKKLTHCMHTKKSVNTYAYLS